MKTPTLGSIILQMKERPSPRPALKFQEKRKWRAVTWKEYYQQVALVASAFQNLGLQPQEKVALMSNTRWEWAVCDLAVLGLHAVLVPIYQNSTPDDVEFILNHSEASILVCENKLSLLAWRKIRERCPHIKTVICFEIDKPEDKSIVMWSRFLETGSENISANQEKFERLCDTLKPEHNATIVYTSGTTGRPKGVLITHEQVHSEVSEVLPYCGMTAQDTTLTFLPFAHVMGRIEHWGHVFIGFTMAYAESIEKIRYNLPDVKPTVLVAVPRIFEKVYSQVMTQAEAQKLKKKIFDWAIQVGRQVAFLHHTRQTVPLKLMLEYEAAKKLVLNKIRQALGGRLRFALCGGAPMSLEVAEFFNAAGVLILEGYGLTETTAAVTVNSPYNYRFGSVGRPVGEVKVKIAEDGEILLKSKKVMKSYYKDPVATAEVLKDGWFYTGDIGQILASGDLKITDRKKDLIKTAGGKYVAPQKLENLLKVNPMISHALVHGDKKKYIVCLITLDRLYLEQWAKEKNWTYNRWTDLIEQPEVMGSVKKTVRTVNESLSSYESIKGFKILPAEFTVEGGELTPSLKVKRKLLDSKYHEVIESLYAS